MTLLRPNRNKESFAGSFWKALLPLMGELLEATILVPLEHKLASK